MIPNMIEVMSLVLCMDYHHPDEQITFLIITGGDYNGFNDFKIASMTGIYVSAPRHIAYGLPDTGSPYCPLFSDYHPWDDGRGGGNYRNGGFYGYDADGPDKGLFHSTCDLPLEAVYGLAIVGSPYGLSSCSFFIFRRWYSYWTRCACWRWCCNTRHKFSNTPSGIVCSSNIKSFIFQSYYLFSH